MLSAAHHSTSAISALVGGNSSSTSIYTEPVQQKDNHQAFNCKYCHKSLNESQYIPKEDQPYCVPCYEQLFAHPCTECKQKIGVDSKDLCFKDKHWHEKCYFCHECKQQLPVGLEKPFGLKNDKLYCADCYNKNFATRCDKCNLIIKSGTKKIETNGHQYHESCFKCSGCDIAIGTKGFIQKDNKIYCEACYDHSFSRKCSKCNNSIGSGSDGVKYKEKAYHKSCFQCVKCKKSLACELFTNEPNTTQESPCCLDCYAKYYALKCNVCHQPIGTGRNHLIKYKDHHWHKECYVCIRCNTSLVGRGFVSDASSLICPDCGKN